MHDDILDTGLLQHSVQHKATEPSFIRAVDNAPFELLLQLFGKTIRMGGCSPFLHYRLIHAGNDDISFLMNIDTDVHVDTVV